jgi:transposase InsO family protein
MIELLLLILHIVTSLFKPRAKLAAEILVLRQQLNVLRRQVSKRPQLSNTDRFLFVWLYRWFPSVLSAIAILRPETIIRWHREGFQSYWRARSGKPIGRPRISAELRNLIGAMSRANHLWGAPHIHGELLKLGFTIAQSTVARYMYRGWPPSQGWRTFLTNHVDGIAAIDLFVLPTITFRLLYCLVILRHGRRLWVSFGVTTNPTAEWISRQITEAFPWDSAPRYLIRDRDTAYGPVFVQRLRAMGIRDKPTAPRSPWQNPYVERLIGTIRRECLDHLIVFGEAHLRRILGKYAAYYNESRIHRSLDKDAPFHRAIEHVGVITSQPVLGGLHHQYCRI